MTAEFFIVLAVFVFVFVWISIFMLLRLSYSDANESDSLPDQTEDKTGNPRPVVAVPELESTTALDSQSLDTEQPSNAYKTIEEHSSIYPFIWWGIALGCPIFLLTIQPFNYNLMTVLTWLAVLKYLPRPILTSNQRRVLSELTTVCLNIPTSVYQSIKSLLSRCFQLASQFVSIVLTSRKRQEDGEPSNEMPVNDLLECITETDQRTQPPLDPPTLPTRSGQNMTQWFYAKGDQKYGPVDFEELKRLAANGKLASSDLIWSPGYEDWIPAWKASGLFSSNPIPPPLKIAAGMTSNANVSSEGASSSSNEIQKLIEKRLMTITRLLLPIVMGSVTGLIAVAFGKDFGQVAAVISLAVIVIQVLVVYCSGIVLW